MGFSETAGGLSKELKFWRVSRELGSDLGQAMARLDVLGHYRTAGSSRSQERNWECVKWDVSQRSGVFCMVLLLLNEILQSPLDPSP